MDIINENWFKTSIEKNKKQFKLFFVKLKKQFKHNKQANKILLDYVKSGKMTNEDSKLLSGIVVDTFKMVGLGAIVGVIPAGSALLALLLKFSKRFNINLLPSQFEAYTYDDTLVNFSTLNLKEVFDEVNKDCFNGELPYLPLKIKKLKQVAGRFVYRLNRREISISQEKIEISSFFKMTMEKLRNIMCHEMIHFKNAIDNPLKIEQHGFDFMSEMNRINKLNIGYKISVTDDAPGEYNDVDHNVLETLIILGETSNDKTRLYTIMNPKSVGNDIITNGVNVLNVYKTTHPDIMKFSRGRKLKWYYMNYTKTTEILENIIKSSNTEDVTKKFNTK